MNVLGAPPPLLAAVELKLIFLIVMAVIYVVNHILGAMNKAQPPKPAARRPDPRPPAAQVGQQRGGQQQVKDEVSEFLRKAAEKRGAGKPRPVEVVRPGSRPAERPVRRLEMASLEAPVQAEVVEASPTGARVADHVRHHLDNREFEARARELVHASEGVQVLESHLHQKFDHQVGRLAAQGSRTGDEEAFQAKPAVTLEAAAASGVSLAALMADPQSLRQAIILQEIIGRPVHRW